MEFDILTSILIILSSVGYIAERSGYFSPSNRQKLKVNNRPLIVVALACFLFPLIKGKFSALGTTFFLVSLGELAIHRRENGSKDLVRGIVGIRKIALVAILCAYLWLAA